MGYPQGQKEQQTTKQTQWHHRNCPLRSMVVPFCQVADLMVCKCCCDVSIDACQVEEAPRAADWEGYSNCS